MAGLSKRSLGLLKTGLDALGDVGAPVLVSPVAESPDRAAGFDSSENLNIFKKSDFFKFRPHLLRPRKLF
jgi:hypothetical protein